MRIAAIIPARGGSKGVPGKNIRILKEKPLITYSIEQAIQSSFITDVYVSTDDKYIKEVAEHGGAKVISRPYDISGDNASSESALLHVLGSINVEFDYIVFLQCTSPFRKPSDIDNAILKIVEEKSDSLLSVISNHRFLWRNTTLGVESINYDYKFRPRRQDMSIQYQENGSIYIFKPWVLKETSNRLGGKISMYVMGEMSGVDIDSEFDFTLAEALLSATET